MPKIEETGVVIDLHCHILPAVDDGPETVDEALEMARAAAADGVRTIVATPHFGETPRGQLAEARRALEDLREALRRAGSRIAILPGAEVELSPGLPRLAATGVLPTINDGPYLLVEPHFDALPLSLEHVIFRLQTLGLRPILAHPERCVALQDDADLLVALVNRGMLAQVNAGSLTGVYGQHVRRVARELVGRRLVHVIASDAHAAEGRTTRLREAVEEAASLVGRAEAEGMVREVPAAIVAGQPVRTPRVEMRAGRWRPWWAFWRR